LARLLAAKVPVIDIRTAPEWEETGVVPGSKLITFFDERGRVDPGAWLEKAKGVGNPGDPVILICRTGNRTRAAAQFLTQQVGYAKVYNVRAGIRAWMKDGRPVAPAAPLLAECRTAKTC
jgi:rhodanese-related sulfurtransferase